MIKRLNTKSAFGSETLFTEFLGGESGRKHLENLFMECFGHTNIIEDTITEKYTSQGKRVDIVVRKNDSVVTIECQDTCGALDANHAGKSQVYAFNENAIYNILLCESSDEEMREYIRFENEHPRKNNFVVEYRILQNDSTEIHIEWIPVVKPFEIPRKKAQTITAMRDVERQKRSFGVTFADVFAGKFPITLENKKYVAVMYNDETVELNKNKYTSLSQAQKAVEPDLSQNAWTWWKYQGVYLKTYQLEYMGTPLEEVKGTWLEPYHPEVTGLNR